MADHHYGDGWEAESAFGGYRRSISQLRHNEGVKAKDYDRNQRSYKEYRTTRQSRQCTQEIYGDDHDGHHEQIRDD